jgi:hypothetical protein
VLAGFNYLADLWEVYLANSIIVKAGKFLHGHEREKDDSEGEGVGGPSQKQRPLVFLQRPQLLGRKKNTFFSGGILVLSDQF